MAPVAEGSTTRHSGRVAQPLDPGHAVLVPVTDIVRSLQFYLDELGCVVHEVADGCALLGSGPYVLPLIHQPLPDQARHQSSPDPQTPESARPHLRLAAATPIPAPSLIRLSTSDVRALQRRLGCRAVLAGAVPGSLTDSADAIETCDPDRRRVVVVQLR